MIQNFTNDDLIPPLAPLIKPNRKDQVGDKISDRFRSSIGLIGVDEHGGWAIGAPLHVISSAYTHRTIWPWLMEIVDLLQSQLTISL